MTKKNILITGIGSGGANNLVDCIRSSCQDEINIIGSNCVDFRLNLSNADLVVPLPHANSPEYSFTLLSLIEKYSINGIIPTTDIEAYKLSTIPELSHYTYLPSQFLISSVQDKASLFDIASSASLRVPKSSSLSNFEDVFKFFDELPPNHQRIWVRPRLGAGSRGATWVKTPQQAIQWITLWSELRGKQISDFHLCEFLPGRDLNIQTIWFNGQFISGTMVQRLMYYGGDAKLSGMASTPAVARRIFDKDLASQIELIGDSLKYPLHGSINFDLKQDINGIDCMTEINIGRFPMIIKLHEACRSIASHTSIYLQHLIENKSLSTYGWLDSSCQSHMFRELDISPVIVDNVNVNFRLESLHP